MRNVPLFQKGLSFAHAGNTCRLERVRILGIILPTGNTWPTGKNSLNERIILLLQRGTHRVTPNITQPVQIMEAQLNASPPSYSFYHTPYNQGSTTRKSSQTQIRAATSTSDVQPRKQLLQRLEN